MKNILFVASEGVPFIKTGGLADVVGSLPKYYDKRYFDARVILPKYMCMSAPEVLLSFRRAFAILGYLLFQMNLQIALSNSLKN